MMVFRTRETEMDSMEKYLSATEVIDWDHSRDAMYRSLPDWELASLPDA
jgi:hypothetical protein